MELFHLRAFSQGTQGALGLSLVQLACMIQQNCLLDIIVLQLEVDQDSIYEMNKISFLC